MDVIFFIRRQSSPYSNENAVSRPFLGMLKLPVAGGGSCIPPLPPIASAYDTFIEIPTFNGILPASDYDVIALAQCFVLKMSMKGETFSWQSSNEKRQSLCRVIGDVETRVWNQIGHSELHGKRMANRSYLLEVFCFSDALPSNAALIEIENFAFHAGSRVVLRKSVACFNYGMHFPSINSLASSHCHLLRRNEL